MTERTIPDPPAGMRYKTVPLPEPPRRGLWLDPDDPNIARYHNGRKWTDATTSSLVSVDDEPESFSTTVRRLPAFFWINVGIVVLGLAGVLCLSIAGGLRTNTAGYHWANRLGILCLLGIFVPLALYAIIGPIVRHTQTVLLGRVLLIIVGLIPVSVFSWAYWDRIRDALWFH
jgi:hypothetical protein